MEDKGVCSQQKYLLYFFILAVTILAFELCTTHKLSRTLSRQYHWIAVVVITFAVVVVAVVVIMVAVVVVAVVVIMVAIVVVAIVVIMVAVVVVAIVVIIWSRLLWLLSWS